LHKNGTTDAAWRAVFIYLPFTTAMRGQHGQYLDIEQDVGQQEIEKNS
jgi:hypothetical protein